MALEEDRVGGGESLRDSRGHVEALVGVGGERPYFFLPGRAAPSAVWCSCGCGGLGLTGTWQDLARLFFATVSEWRDGSW